MTENTTTKVREWVLGNTHLSYEEMASSLAGETEIVKSPEAIRKIYQKLVREGLAKPKKLNSQNTSPLSDDQQFKIDMEKVRQQFAHKAVDKRYKVALNEITRLEGELHELHNLKDTVSTYTIGSRGTKRGEAVAVALLSDTHIEENVIPETVDGTNEYTLKIAKKRMEAFFRNVVKLLKKEQQDTEIKTLVLAILGDLISSNIHEELLESCEVPPVEAAVLAQNFIASGIEHILANTTVDIIVPTCCGNHSRITHKVHVSKEQGNSLEYMIYANLANHFRNNKRVKLIITKSYFTWVNVLGYDIRFHHGHAMKFGGGIGGLTIPVLKAIARYDQEKKAYLDCFGHFHNQMDGGKFVCNGSMIGNTPYGMRLGFTGRPTQTFFLIQAGYGKTGVFPVFMD